MDQVRKEHQITVSQFLVEIRMLHKRIEGLEAAASIDAMSGFFNRTQMEEHIRSATAGTYHLLLFQVRGLTRAEAQFGTEVGEELAGAFSKRLKNTLPQHVVLGRWSTEEFIAMTGPSKDRASSQWIAERLSGIYTCIQSGKTVRPALEVTLGIVESTSQETAGTTLERVGTFLTSE